MTGDNRLSQRKPQTNPRCFKGMFTPIEALNERGYADQSKPGVKTELRVETSGSEPEYPVIVAMFSAETNTLAELICAFFNMAAEKL